MSDSQQTSRSDYPNAPKISHHLYIQEKAYFSGVFIGPILYGILVVLFFRCMAALFNPACRRGEGIKWGLTCYTVVMFLVATVVTGMGFDLQSNSYINNRKFPGVGNVLPPGPLGYQSFIFSDEFTTASNFMFFLNGWLADGLLLYRCYIIYSMNLWVIAFPCLMYLGSLGAYLSPQKLAVTSRANIINTATGIMFQAAARSKDTSYATVVFDFGLPYISISVSLNILLTLLIAIRLILHTRNTRTVIRITGTSGLCEAIVTMLIESCALYTMSSLLVVAPWVAGYHDDIIFVPVLSQAQVIAPLLVIQRVANRSALTSNAAISRNVNLSRTMNQGMTTGGSSTLPCGDPPISMDDYGTNTSDLGIVRI